MRRFPYQHEKIVFSREEKLLVMRARGDTVADAMTELEAEYQSRPRLAAMRHEFCHIWNTASYGSALAYDAEYYECSPDPALRQLAVDLTRILRVTAKLRADPYVCKTQRTIDTWGKFPGTPWAECNSFRAKKHRRADKSNVHVLRPKEDKGGRS